MRNAWFPFVSNKKGNVSDEKVELKQHKNVTKFLYTEELKKKPPSPSKLKKKVRFASSEPTILGEEDVGKKDVEEKSCVHNIIEEKKVIRVKVKMTKQEAALMLSKYKEEGVLEFKDVARELVSIPVNRVSMVSVV
ncbi:Nipped-B-like protein [Quillaja saponaria]|uniref:Nipped-B-like protein n=1 Tax=Quillaja saponaria TaxID=32244 RepID=A0AAD7KTU3_QUISA|nr:Nipped-B-like protein [Quillaja saponaria]